MGILRDGAIELQEAVKDGEYLVFAAASSGELVLMKHTLLWPVLLAAAVMVLGVIGWQMTRKKGKSRGKTEQVPEAGSQAGSAGGPSRKLSK